LDNAAGAILVLGEHPRDDPGHRICDFATVAAAVAVGMRATPETIDGQPPLPMPAVCPVTWDELTVTS
jgi:hypothetical protein